MMRLLGTAAACALAAASTTLSHLDASAGPVAWRPGPVPAGGPLPHTPTVNFLNKLVNDQNPYSLSEFYRWFAPDPIGHGYSTVLASDYYGLGNAPTVQQRLDLLGRTLLLAAEFERVTTLQNHPITPRIIFDVKGYGFLDAPAAAFALLATAPRFSAGLHTDDEPDIALDAGCTLDVTPSELRDMLRPIVGTSEPLWITFENQWGIPRNAAHWSSCKTEQKYFEYLDVLRATSTSKVAYVGIDYYAQTRHVDRSLPNRAVHLIPDQTVVYEMMAEASSRIRRYNASRGTSYGVFNWTETVYQGLSVTRRTDNTLQRSYICSELYLRESQGTPLPMAAVFSQRFFPLFHDDVNAVGDFSHIFAHLCLSPDGKTSDGLSHPYYVTNGHRLAVRIANALTERWAHYWPQAAIPLGSNNPLVKGVLRIGVVNGRAEGIWGGITNLSGQPQKARLHVPAALTPFLRPIGTYYGMPVPVVWVDQNVIEIDMQAWATRFLENPGARG